MAVRISAFLFLVSMMALAACQSNPPIGEPPQDYVVADGLAIADKQCSGCHAIGLQGSSPNTQAPPFREIVQRYQFPVLEQELDEGVRVGHPNMPAFQFAPRGTDSLLAYLRDLQTKARAEENKPAQ